MNVAPTLAEEPSRSSPIPLRVRSDLVWQRISFQGDGTWVAKDPATLSYYRLTDHERELLFLLNGARSSEEIRDALRLKFPSRHYTTSAVQRHLGELHDKQLTVSTRVGQELPLRKKRRKKRWQKVKQLAGSFLFMKFPGVDPTPLLKLLYPISRWLFHPLFVIPSLIVVAAAYGWLLAHLTEFQQDLPSFSQFFGWPNLIFLGITLAVLKVFHELGHGLVCHHYGAECREMGAMLLVFSPTLYCDVSDSWMLRSKWQRMAIGAAGMYVEILLSVIALMIWWNTRDGLAHYLALNVFFVTSVSTTLFNANPLMKLDGYYILSDYLEIANLRQHADRHLRHTFVEQVLGVPVDETDEFEPHEARGWFALFTVASSIYRIVLIVTIGLFLWHMLKPYRLEVLGGLAITVSLSMMAIKAFQSVFKMVRKPREEKWNRRRFAISLAIFVAAIAAIAAIGMIPCPTYLEAPFVVEPAEGRRIISSLPGTLSVVHVEPGDHVSTGQLLLELENEEYLDRRRDLNQQLEIQQSKANAFRASRDYANRVLAEEEVASLRAEIAELQHEFEFLKLRSPLTGDVVSAGMVPSPSIESTKEKLPHAFGDPIDHRNLGSLVPEQTHLMTIAPSDTMQAVLYFDQSDRNLVEAGQRVRLKFDHLPRETVDGELVLIAEREERFAPVPLSNKSGGSLATESDPQGRETLSSVAYCAIVRLPAGDSRWEIADLRGRARCIIADRTLANLVYEWFRRTIYVRL